MEKDKEVNAAEQKQIKIKRTKKSAVSEYFDHLAKMRPEGQTAVMSMLLNRHMIDLPSTKLLKEMDWSVHEYYKARQFEVSFRTKQPHSDQLILALAHLGYKVWVSDNHAGTDYIHFTTTSVEQVLP